MNEILPIDCTGTLEEASGWTRVRHNASGMVEEVECPQARFGVAVDWSMVLEFDSTLTAAEAREKLLQMLPSMARTQCFLIIKSLPGDVIPVVLPQLKEMAEYETKMWQLRQELTEPDIRQEWISLPIRK